MTSSDLIVDLSEKKSDRSSFEMIFDELSNAFSFSFYVRQEPS